MGKGSRRHKGGKRKTKQREQKPSFHILCEGLNSEPLYFKQFPIPNIGYCKGYGKTKIPLVNEALKYKRANNINSKSKDQIWVVFDYDYNGKLQPKQKEEFNKAIKKAEQNNINWAVSNDAFELWYVLHYRDCNAKQLRDWYYKKLKDYIGSSYDKDRQTAKKMYGLLLPNQEVAIKRATILKEKYNENDMAHADKNPFTTVQELVIELNKYKKDD